MLLIEPLNPRDRPDYFLNRVEHAADIIGKVGAPNLRIQFDFYHVQIVSGDLIRRFEAHLPLIGHVADRRRCRDGASPTRAKSIIRRFSRRSIGSAMPASSAASTARAGAPRTGLPGRGLMVSCRKDRHSARAAVARLRVDVSWLLGTYGLWGQGHVGTKRQNRRDGGRERTAIAAERGDACGAHRGRRAHQRRRRSARRRSGASRAPQRGARSVVCRNSAPRSICSIAASAGATRRGCGSMRSPMSPWGATSACTASCTTPAIGRRVLAESHEIADIVKAVTDYVARRLVERERALDEDPEFITRIARPEAARTLRRRRRRGWGTSCARLCAWRRSRCCSPPCWSAEPHVDASPFVPAPACSITRAFAARPRATLPSAPRSRAIISQRQPLPSASMRNR